MAQREAKPRPCKKCGLGNLYWKNFNGSWRLAVGSVDGPLHDCPARKRNVSSPTANPSAVQTWNPQPAVEPSAQPAVDVQPEPSWIQQAKRSVVMDQPEPVQPSTVGTEASAAMWNLVQPHALQAMNALLATSGKTSATVRTELVVSRESAEPVVIKGAHQCTPLLVKLMAKPNRNVMIVGPAGTGKTLGAQHVAEALGLKFWPMSVGPQTSKTDLLGYTDANGKLVRSLFREAYEHGGLFLLDEVDAGNAAVLTILNAALSGDRCSFPDGIVFKHADFRLVAAANTFGMGASRQYVGRNQLDAATLNRFLVVKWGYDETVERSIAADCPDWFSRVMALRRAQEATGVRVIISTRALVYGASLLADGFSQAEVEDFALWNGVSEDDRAKLESAA